MSRSEIEEALAQETRDREKAASEKALRLLRHIEEQIDKRQYLNAATATSELTRELLAAFSAVLKSER